MFEKLCAHVSRITSLLACAGSLRRALCARGGGLAWAQLIASHFLLFIIAKLCYVCVVTMHCVVPSARLTHVCGHILVLATSDCICELTRARRRALVLTTAQQAGSTYALI